MGGKDDRAGPERPGRGLPHCKVPQPQNEIYFNEIGLVAPSAIDVRDLCPTSSLSLVPWKLGSCLEPELTRAYLDLR